LFKENIKNLIYQSFAQVIPRAILFIFTLYLARYLGSNEYGKYDFSISFGYLMGAFFELGGNLILTKYVARGVLGVYKYAFRIRIASIMLTLVILVAVMLISGLYSNIFYHVTFAVLGIALSSLMNLYFSFFRGIKKMNYEAIVLLIQKVLFVLICIVLLMSNKNSFYAVVGFAASMFISLLIIQAIFFYKKPQYTKGFTAPIPTLNFYIKDLATLALVDIFTIANFRVTQIILKSFAEFNDVGVYAASYRVVEAFANIPAIVMIVFFPGFARLAVENMVKFMERFRKVLIVLVVLGTGAGIVSWFGGEAFFKLLGKDYGKSYILVRYMSLSMIVMFPNYLLSQSLIAMDKNLKYAFVVLVTLTVNVIVGLILVPNLGSAGSAISVAACEFVIFTGCLILIIKEFRKVGTSKT
jgi:O-antigen/teichoic acid export membrane protein